MRDWRASDNERGAVVEKLQEAVAEGRITLTEFDARVAAALEARTIGELDGLTADLPRSLW